MLTHSVINYLLDAYSVTDTVVSSRNSEEVAIKNSITSGFLLLIFADQRSEQFCICFDSWSWKQWEKARSLPSEVSISYSFACTWSTFYLCINACCLKSLQNVSLHWQGTQTFKIILCQLGKRDWNQDLSLEGCPSDNLCIAEYTWKSAGTFISIGHFLLSPPKGGCDHVCSP